MKEVERYEYFILDNNTESMIFTYEGDIFGLYFATRKQAREMGLGKGKIKFRDTFLEDEPWANLEYEYRMRKAG